MIPCACMCAFAVNSCSSAPCAPTDGIVTFSSNDDYGSIASFSCNPGFTLSGEATVTCDATIPNAPWEIAATLHTCTGDFFFPT